MAHTRRIKLNYRKVDIAELSNWLAKNHIKYALVPYDKEIDGPPTIGTLVFFLEVYVPRDETAIRIKWNTEQ